MCCSVSGFPTLLGLIHLQRNERLWRALKTALNVHVHAIQFEDEFVDSTTPEIDVASAPAIRKGIDTRRRSTHMKKGTGLCSLLSDEDIPGVHSKVAEKCSADFE